MKKFRVFILTTLICILSVTSVFATTTLELHEKLNAMEEQVTTDIEQAKADIFDTAYPVGSIYTTMEDMSESDMHDMFGGTWEQMKNTFLYATENGMQPGVTGGKKNYEFSAVLGTDGADELSYYPFEKGSYMNKSPDFSLKGETSFEDGLFSKSIPVTEGANRTITILPPYTRVRMFKRTA